MVSYFPSFANNTDIARIAIATNYTQFFSTLGVPDFVPQINENVFGSVFGNNDDINLPSFLCRSGNCVWPIYSTLAVCARCLDLTDRIKIFCDREEICSATLPNGYGLRNSSFMYTNASWTFSKDSFQNLSTPFPISIIQLVKAENTTVITNTSVVIAAECALLPCVQTFSGSIGSYSGKTLEDLAKDGVNDPNLRETPIKTWDNYTVQGMQDIDFVTIVPPSTLDSGIAPGERFTMSYDAFSSLRNGITLRFANGVIKWTNGHHQSTSDLTDAFYKMDNPRCEDHPDGGANNSLICGVQRVAAAMTKAIRQSAWDFNSTSGAADMAPGVTSVPVTRIKISWGWLALPVLLWLVGVFVLIDTAWKTRKTGTPVWKAEALPVLNLQLVPEDEKISSRVEFKQGDVQYGHLDISRDRPVMSVSRSLST
jgi:hypothetical protein